MVGVRVCRRRLDPEAGSTGLKVTSSKSIRPKIHGYTVCKRTGFVKPDSVKFAMGHLLHGEAAPWNRALQTAVPPWIQGLVRYVPCIRCNVAVGLLSATAVLLYLTQFAVPFVQFVTTVCLQGMWFYTILYDTCNAWYMVLRPWVDLIRCSLNQLEHLSTLPFDWGKLVYSVANQNPGLMRQALSK